MKNSYEKGQGGHSDFRKKYSRSHFHEEEKKVVRVTILEVKNVVIA